MPKFLCTLNYLRIVRSKPFLIVWSLGWAAATIWILRGAV